MPEKDTLAALTNLGTGDASLDSMRERDLLITDSHFDGSAAILRTMQVTRGRDGGGRCASNDCE
jgi:hypothetical protein